MTEAEEIIAKLDLKPLPEEGGFFFQSWKSTESMANGRPAGTAIYFLLTAESFSAFHRLNGPEIWHFYAGWPVEHFQLSSVDGLKRVLLGPRLLDGHLAQLVVPGGSWQAARVAHENPRDIPTAPWSLVGCTMTPGWDARDFSLANRANLQQEFPSHAELVRKLTRANEGNF